MPSTEATTARPHSHPERRFEQEHSYGSHVHLIHDPVANTWLTRLCQHPTRQPELHRLVEKLYAQLLHRALNREAALTGISTLTRMDALHGERARLSALGLDRDQNAVVVSLARAGTFPGHICFDLLCDLLDPDRVRQDHIMASRLVDSTDTVTGTQFGAAKIGGSVENSLVIVPDPMGATGSTLSQTIRHYKTLHKGHEALKWIVLCLIVTPEMIRRMRNDHPEAIIYAFRVDRGMSSAHVFETVPGSLDEETGLDSRGYIVPGAGGVGELLNNTTE
jgi:uracil phosphoribosyltransferase